MRSGSILVEVVGESKRVDLLRGMMRSASLFRKVFPGSARAPCHYSRVVPWSRTFLGSLRSLGRRFDIWRNGNRGNIVEYNNRIRGYISFTVYLDSEMADKSRVRNLFIVGFIQGLHAWKILSIYYLDVLEISSGVDLSRETSYNRSCSSNDTQQPKNTRLVTVMLKYCRPDRALS